MPQPIPDSRPFTTQGLAVVRTAPDRWIVAIRTGPQTWLNLAGAFPSETRAVLAGLAALDAARAAPGAG